MLRIAVLALAGAATVGLPADAAGQVGKNLGLKNPNLATKKELAELPHLDAATIDVILEKRPFLGIEKLDAVLAEKLDETQREELYRKMWVPIHLNAASSATLQLIPGVGPRIAHEFEEYRPYQGLAQFRREIGKYVAEKEVARLEQYVFLPIDLNTASEADIQSIPGVGPRLTREFLEYRPYKDIEQFRREIGKYVDAKEVARLERYVTLNPAQHPVP